MFENFILTNSPEKISGYCFNSTIPRATMIIIHGIGEYAGRYDRLASILGEDKIRIYSMDLPGHGMSTGIRGDASPRYEVLEYIDQLVACVKEKYPNLPTVLYGHSMGGNIALDYKYRGNLAGELDGFIISAPWIRLVRPVSKLTYNIVKLGSKFAPKFKIRSQCNEKDLGNLLYVKPYSSNPLVHPYITMRCALDGFDIGKAIDDGCWKDEGKTIGKPFLLMQGTEDKLCGVEGARSLAEQNSTTPGFEYVEWEGYFHEIHNGNDHETGEKVIKKISKFIVDEIIGK
ncbi:alpha/beta fold hydrolase [Eubacteriales bacterium KG127]